MQKHPNDRLFWFLFWGSLLGLSVATFRACSDLASASSPKKTDAVVLTLAQWRKIALNKAERIRRNKELKAQVVLLQSMLETERKAAIASVLAERVRCGEIQKAVKCSCPSNTGLFVCLGVCGAVAIGGTLGGVALGSHLKTCP